MPDEEDQPFASPVSVLLVVDRGVYERLGSVVWHLGVGMVDEPVRLTILAHARSYPSGDSIGPYRLVTLPPRWLPWSRPSADEVLRLIGGERPNVVHCMSADLARAVQPWVRQWDSRLIVHLTDPHDARLFGRFSRGIRAHGVAINTSVKQQAVQMRRIDEDRIHLIPLGLPADKEAACLSQPERIPAVIVTTPLQRGCGLEAVFKSLQNIIREKRELQLFLLSQGPAERHYRRLAEQMHLRPWVTFAGRMRNWAAQRDAMRGGDIFLISSPRQRFTINSLIAMAAGLAVIAPAGTPEDYLIDGQTASLYDPLNPQSLTERWLDLIDDRANTRLMAERALGHVSAHYQASAMAAALGRLYRAVREPD